MKLIIHAGFGKTGSSAIQGALDRYSVDLASESIVKFGEDFEFSSRRIPQAAIEAAWREERSLVDSVVEQLKCRPALSILSSENLSLPGRSKVFTGIDRLVDTHVVFYVRPQQDWIPSAWKQWYLKDGTGLKEYAERCIRDGSPNYLSRLIEWRHALPKAHVEARVFSGNVVGDFFKVCGSVVEPENRRSNDSFDYSLQHLMAKQAKKIFSGPHDVKVEQWLRINLPGEYLKANAPMLDYPTAKNIAERFKDENIRLLKEFSRVGDPSSLIAREWYPKKGAAAYLDMREEDVEARAIMILDGIGPKAKSHFGL